MNFDREAKRAAVYLSRPLNLKEIRLPAGDVGSVNIGWANNGAAIKLDPQTWLAAGYDGVRLIGDGRTAMRCSSWDGITLAVGRHDGVVQLEGVDLFAGYRSAVQFGEQNFDGQRRADGSLIHGTQRIACPSFQFRFIESRGHVLPPEEQGGARTMWLLFGYQSDVLLRDVELNAGFARQHPSYWHGAAKRGWFWQRVKVRDSAGENFKVRSDASETAWAGPNVWAILSHCQLTAVGQAHSDYGGCGVNLQGAACHGLVEDTVIRGGSGATKCFMVSSEANSYDILTGSITSGFGNGYVMARRVGMHGSAPGFWNNSLMNVYRNGGAQKSAQGAAVLECAAYGKNTALNFTGDIPNGKTLVKGCNTEAIKVLAARIGFDVTSEAVIPTANRLVPVSEGLAR